MKTIMKELRLQIVEDDPLMRDMIGCLARESGFAVQTATGISFADVYLDFCPDVIVLDILMPQTDGFEVLRFLSARRSSARIVIISAGLKGYLKMAKSLADGLSLPIEAGISKPFEPAQVRQVLENIRDALLLA